MPEDYEDTGDDMKSVYVLGIFYSLLIGVGFLGLTIGKALTEPELLTRFTVYSIILIVGWLFFYCIKSSRMKGYLPNAFTMIHDPELGVFEKFKTIISPINLLIFSAVVNATMALMSSISSNVAVYLFPLQTGIALQQVTKFGGIFFSLEAASAENVIIYIMVTLVLSLFISIAKVMDLPAKYGYYFSIPFILGLGYYLFAKIHVLVSGSDELITVGHGIFGVQLAGSYILTGSIIFGDVLHWFNNLFFSVKAFFGSSEYLLYTFSIVLGIIILVGIFKVVLSQTKERYYG